MLPLLVQQYIDSFKWSIVCFLPNTVISNYHSLDSNDLLCLVVMLNKCNILAALTQNLTACFVNIVYTNPPVYWRH